MQTFRFNPRGVVDALDGGQIPEGGLSAAVDLIFDPANPFTFECRPAAIRQSIFAPIPAAAFVPAGYVIGDMVYGMIGSSTVMGYDIPFAFNLANNTFVTVTGTQDATTLPLSQSPTGTWTPPTMDLVGTLLYITHPGFIGGASAYFGWFDTTNPAAPVWNAGNTGTNPLPSPPVAVAQFNNRAWFAVKNNVHYTDALSTNVTGADQILTIGDSIPITALAPQPQSTSVQGIIQSLIAFKPDLFGFITGDSALGNLALNIDKSEVGTSAPRTISATSKGTRFMAKDGIRLIDRNGTLQDPDPNLKTPFVYALTPSRASSAYNNNIYRITVQNGHVNGNPFEEYWFDERQNGWTGPHTFTQDLAIAHRNQFVVFRSTLAPSLWTSSVVQDGTSTYVENGNAMQFFYRTAPLADNGSLYENTASLSVIDLQLPTNGDRYTFAASDVNRGVLSVANIDAPTTGAIWGAVTWGAFTWTPVTYGMDRYNIPWTEPLVFSRMILQASGPSSSGFKIGKLSVGYQPMKYIRIR